MLRVTESVVAGSELVTILVKDCAMRARNAAHALLNVRYAVHIPGALCVVTRLARLASKDVPGSASIKVIAACRVRHHAAAFLVIYAAPKYFHAVTNVLACVGSDVQKATVKLA
ncbi:hypothetical protein ACLMJK_003689 [Lecanora helva]